MSFNADINKQAQNIFKDNEKIMTHKSVSTIICIYVRIYLVNL